MGVVSPTRSVSRTWSARVAALVTALLVSVLGLSVPTAAQAAGNTVSGVISFPASAPSSVKQPINQSAPSETRSGIYLTLYKDQPGTVEGWEYGVDANVTFNAATGAWAVTGVPDGAYRLTINVILPNNGSANGVNRTLTVSGANFNAGTTAITERARFRAGVGSCAAWDQSTVTSVKNTATGTVYPLESQQSGWGQPEPRCVSGETSYGNTGFPDTANAPAGNYILFTDANGIREYYTAEGNGSTNAADATTLALKLWEGTTVTQLLKTVRPTIPGTAKVGSAITAATGTWATGATLSYQWKLNGTPIPGATSPSYTPVASDLSKSLTFAVTGSVTDESGLNTSTETMTSAAVTVAAGTLTAPTPTISGTAAIGSTVTATAGSWTAGTTLAYQWKRDGAAISGATASTYALVAADGGKSITVSVTGTKAGYQTATSTSAAKAIPLGTLISATPVISGAAKVGSTLKFTRGSWTAGTSFAYQWKRNGVAISGATGTSYQVSASDAGKALTVSVTGSQAGYATATKESAATAKVALGTLTSTTPRISGTQKVGSTLKLIRGSWTSGTTFTYRWYRDGKPISGATKSSYKLPSSSAGHKFRVKVHGVKTGYTTLDRYSAYTGAIRK